MGAAAGAVSGVSSLAAVGFSAYGAIEKGKGTKSADEYKAAQEERSALYGRANAEETNAIMTENLNKTLTNIDVTRSAAHADPTSPTGAAVRDINEYIGNRQKNVAVENILAQSEQEEADARYLRQAGKFAMGMGELDAAAAVAKGVGGTDFSSFGAA
jgi:hypothetical protein